jgi:hypothetical protein
MIMWVQESSKSESQFKDMKILRLRIKLRINKLSQGPICNCRKLNRGLTEKIRNQNVITERWKGF